MGSAMRHVGPAPDWSLAASPVILASSSLLSPHLVISNYHTTTASLSFCHISLFYTFYSSFTSLLIAFASFLFSSTFVRTFGEGIRAAERIRHHLDHRCDILCSSSNTIKYATQLGWPPSPVAQLNNLEIGLAVDTTAQQSALELNANNLDGLPSHSKTLEPLIARRGGRLNPDEDRHTNCARLDVGGVAGTPEMMRFYPWNTNAQGGHKMAKAAESQPHISGIQQVLSKNTQDTANGKRKRSIGQEGITPVKVSPVTTPNNLTSSTIQRANATVHTSALSPSPFFPSAAKIDSGPTPPMSPATSPSKQEVVDEPVASNSPLSAGRLEFLKRNLQTQIGLEILVKHKELRLIDQELAKCQIAYEQLRRCTEIPYPGTQTSSDVSNGAGPPAQNVPSGPLARSPAPWGVTDGPYSRHYAKWLLPDPEFDGGDDSFAAGQHSEYARSTRGKPIETPVSAGKRGNKSNVLLLPSVPKDKSGPMIIKRKSDGKWVKLRCLDCARDDFGSAQGFINHCRIQHHRSFISHDAAAAACGELVEVDPAGAVVGAPLVQPTITHKNGAVHPLIRSAHLIKPSLETVESTDQTPLSEQIQPQHGHGHDTPPMSTNVSAQSTPNRFQASSYTPNLSALIRNRGLGINVQDLVTDAKSKAFVLEADDSASDMDIDTDTPTTEPFRGQHPQVAGKKQPAHPTQTRIGGKTSSFGQLRGGAVLPSMHTDLLSRASSELELEPSPTNESNQAPSLVDDDEDDDYEGHSPTSSSESGDDHSEVDFHIEDEDVAGPSNLSPLYPDSGKSQIGNLERRPSAFRRRFSDNREEKHVSFVSPSPAREMSVHHSKRRKMCEINKE
jgi:ADA HAT complex component 1